jgi:DNA-binding NarL/FixJ family response regulator
MRPRRQFVVYDGTAETNHVAALAREFELFPAATPERLQYLVVSQPIHGVILHFHSLKRDHFSLIKKLHAFTACLPAIILAEDWDLDSVKHCAEAGVDALIACTDKREQILKALDCALRTGIDKSGFLYY